MTNPSEEPTEGGPVPRWRCELHFLGHSTVRVELAGRTVLTDPLLTRGLGPLRRVVAPPEPASWAGVDLVVVSHLHNDHLHLPSLRRLGRRIPIVVPRGAGGWLRRHGFSAVEELAPGESLTDGALTVTATPAVHSGHRWGPRFTHGPQAPAVGHLLSGEGTSVYLAGDTDLFHGMVSLGPVDVAVLPVWGWGTSLGPGHLDPLRAAEAVALLRPRVVVPVHWGTLAVGGLTTLPTPWRARMRALLTEPPRTFAAAVAAGRSGAAVALTAPGERVQLPAVERPTDPVGTT
ncbi:L-ascorbate metabolism protein UlaG, beta-lactamase superfamily [Modestobacter sp. DSM 44400]|uniref:MBL fold metallo-hydrolase n=1 Tax=Modestobacter sp. DSM 44400 TaxID=1550230 RepID=UPI0008991724|nr:MBL fold metallo-hydrolase [Modestobacter sp. DSM 44400]SDY39364.1 L-ascorbate metabolism protein UlaG, beta-lactamase superfamily [Modestobacter sp. DSM 44400]